MLKRHRYLAYLIDGYGRVQKMVFEDTEKAVIYARNRGLRIYSMHRADYRGGNPGRIKSETSTVKRRLQVEKKAVDQRSDQNA